MPAWFVSADRSLLKQNKCVRVSHSTSQKASFSDNKAKQENAVGAREALSCLSKWARQALRNSNEEMGIFVKNIQEFHFRRQK